MLEISGYTNVGDVNIHSNTIFFFLAWPDHISPKLNSLGNIKGHILSDVDFWGRNCVRCARRRGGNCTVSAIKKRGFHALPAPGIYTSEYIGIFIL